MHGWDNGLGEAVVAASGAATDPSQWERMLHALCRRFGATAAALHTPRGAPGDRPLLVDVGLPTHTVPDYIAYWSARDPWMAGAERRQICVRSGESGIGRELCEWDELRRLDYYHEFAAPTGVHGLLALIVDDGSRPDTAPMTVIGLYRRQGLEEFSYDDKRALAAAHAPLQMALHAHWSLRRAGLRTEGAIDAFEAIPKPVVVLSGSGMVLHANASGQALLSAGVWVGVVRGRVQRLGHLAHDAVAALLRTVRGGLAQTHPLVHPQAGPQASPAIARLVPLAEHNACRLSWPEAVALLVIDEPEDVPHAQRLQAFARQFRLTPAELHLVVALADGVRLNDFAALNGVSVHTARTHLQNVFDKTGVRRQGDLIRLAAAFFR